MDVLKRYVNDDRFRVDGDKNMRLLAFAFTIVFVWTAVNVYFRKRCENADVRCQRQSLLSSAFPRWRTHEC